MIKRKTDATIVQSHVAKPYRPNQRTCLLVCRDQDKYQAAVEKLCDPSAPIPIISSNLPLQGFPPDLFIIDRVEPKTYESRMPSDPNRIVIALEDGFCNAVAKLLAVRSGRLLVDTKAGHWMTVLDAAIATKELRSLTFVFPSWNERGKPHPGWLRRVLGAMRARQKDTRTIAWGVLSAADPVTLSRLVAKALLEPEITAAYVKATTLMFSVNKASELGLNLPPPDKDKQAPIVLFDRANILSGGIDTIIDRPWNLVFFHGHGRSYCACSGYLCGARKPADPADAELSACIGGMDCANPTPNLLGDGVPPFPCVDPRRYDAPVMLVSCCNSGGWYTEDWENGHTNIAFLALAGAPSAVITSNYTTIERPGETVELLYAFGENTTLGAAVAAINQRREIRDGEFPYYLIGDPECPAAPRTSGWRASITQHELEAEFGATHSLEAIIFSDGRFARLPFPLVAPGTMCYVEGRNGTRIENAKLVNSDGGRALWLDPGPPDTRPDPANIRLECHKLPRIPQHLLSTAEYVDDWIKGWTEELRNYSRSLTEAAARTRQVSAMIETAAEGPTLISPKTLNDLIRLARLEWLEGQRTCVDAATKLSPCGLWPFKLWSHRDYRSMSVEDVCPYCSCGPTLMRTYESPPGPARVQWECVTCTLIEDRPITPIPAFELEVPDELVPGRDNNLKLILQAPDGDGAQGFTIAGAILLDHSNHGAHIMPAFAFEIEPGQTIVEHVRLSFAAPPTIAHRYYVRAILLINGTWVMATRIIKVSRHCA
jgi:hypothetical protein